MAGIGGSNGIDDAPPRPPGPASPAPRRALRPQSAGSSIVKPAAPHARAKAAKSIGCSSQPYSGLPRKTICSHLICPSVLFLTTTTLTGSWYFTQVANSAISIEKPPSPTNATHCRSGIGDLRGDRVRQAARHGREVAGDASASGRARAGMCRAHQVAMVPLSHATIASSRSRRAQLARDAPAASSACRVRVARAPPSARASPSSAPAPSRGSRGRVLRVEQGQQRRERAGAVADQADFDRVAQADPHRVELDLDAARLARAWAGTRCRGTTCRPSAACRTPPAPPARAACRAGRSPPVVYGLSSGTAALPSSALTIGAAEPLGHLLQLVGRAAARRGRPGSRPSVPALSTSAARRRSSSAGSRALRAYTSEVWCGTLRFERWRAGRRPPGGRPGT